MKQHKLKLIFAFIILFGAFSLQIVNAQENDMQEVVDNLTEKLDLSDKQVLQVQTLLIQYRANMDGILLNHQGAEEPDIAGMIGEIRDVRDNYREDLQGILSKDQYASYLAQIDIFLSDMFNDLAEIRLMDVQNEAHLTDTQLESLVPIVGKGLKSTVQLLFENAGDRLSVPKKIKISKSLKKIEKEQRTGMEGILTPEQLSLYDEAKAKQKEERKNKK